jgi:hypothetical protein
LDVVDGRIVEDYTQFCSSTCKVEPLVNKAFTKANTLKHKGQR